jgi:hypothetical protein
MKSLGFPTPMSFLQVATLKNVFIFVTDAAGK